MSAGVTGSVVREVCEITSEIVLSVTQDAKQHFKASENVYAEEIHLTHLLCNFSSALRNESLSPPAKTHRPCSQRTWLVTRSKCLSILEQVETTRYIR